MDATGVAVDEMPCDEQGVLVAGTARLEERRGVTYCRTRLEFDHGVEALARLVRTSTQSDLLRIAQRASVTATAADPIALVEPGATSADRTVRRALTVGVKVRETRVLALGTRNVLLHMNVGRCLRSREREPASSTLFRSELGHAEVRRANPGSPPGSRPGLSDLSIGDAQRRGNR